MKKQVTLVLEVETDDNDEMIKHDLEQEIACCSLYYETKEINIIVLE